MKNMSNEMNLVQDNNALNNTNEMKLELELDNNVPIFNTNLSETNPMKSVQNNDDNNPIITNGRTISNSLTLTLSESEIFSPMDVFITDYHQFIKEVGAHSMAFLTSLANIDDDSALLKLDVKDITIPAKYRLVAKWVAEANELQSQVDTCNKLPDEKSEPSSTASAAEKERYRIYLATAKKVRARRKQAPVVQKAFDNVCIKMVRFDVSKGRFTFDDGTAVVWTELRKLMSEVLGLRKEPFYDGLAQNNRRNLDYDHLIDTISLYNLYYPQQHWAENLPEWDGTDRYELLADTLHMDLSSKEFKVLLTWFKGTMKRWLEPGAKHDTVLVIQGKQGRGKSTFFSNLILSYATGHDVSNKDSLLKYHQYSLVEFDELDALTKKADVAALKKFFSQQEDNIRPPYGRESIIMKRAYACCATANTGDFLKDLTGNRRYITVSVGSNYIESTWLKDDGQRLQFWAQVKADKETLPYVPRELQETQAEMSNKFTHTDSDTETIVEYIQTLTDDMKELGLIIDPRNATGSKTKSPNLVPMTNYNLGFAIFGQEAFTTPCSSRLDKVLSGKLKKVMVDKLDFVYKVRKYEGNSVKNYALK